MRILVVDDEQDLCEILQYNLELEGYEVDTANSAEEALSMRMESYSLLLLDVMMGEMSGFQLARELKKNQATATIPIIFITALDGEDDTVKGLNLGADDYMVKPLSMKETMARVKAVLRRYAPKEETEVPHILQYDRLCIDIERKRVSLWDQEIALTKIEFELLRFLVENEGRVLSRESLLEQCWPKDTVVSDRTVDVNITRLRRKIGPYGECIKTRVGYGYTFEK